MSIPPLSADYTMRTSLGWLPGSYRRTATRSPRLLGVTNLYFLKALPNWPNVLSTGKRTVLQRSISEGGLPVSDPPGKTIWQVLAPLRLSACCPHIKSSAGTRTALALQPALTVLQSGCRASLRANRDRGSAAQ